ncbi:hypothetical protein [Leifsonia sp. Leaf264]|uniref:hypothetical protein n=1 Tax=Leifsonia sp. Leaf264 TaxID=1736314 RepID=UPI0006F84DFC|nr:hypothetical protein [Leifsonia sp. Leaf264]KQO98436.1 hypothetical protein ASF30_10265 [Leifsonia sp. Leaf264]
MTRKLTLLQREALNWLASAGEMRRGRGNSFVWGVIDGRTAGALERLGYAERRYTGGTDDSHIYITAKGLEAAEPVDDDTTDAARHMPPG